MIKRQCKPLLSQSFFLFGARGTGKSTLIQEILKEKNTLILNLLDDEIFERLLHSEEWLEDVLRKKTYEWIVIDEIQLLPKLLNTAHKYIEKTKQKFALTGSSSRKLKQSGANLLAGRAFYNALYPMTSIELGKKFILKDFLRWGSLPKIFSLKSDEEKSEFLKTYCRVYLKEEILQEQLVRKIQPFRDFLPVAAQCSGKIINYSHLAREAGVHVPTVQNYYQILEDTHLGFYLPAFHKSIRKSQLLSPKFYLFDNGVKKALEGSLSESPSPQTSSFGELFEAFVIQEIYRLNDYARLDFRLSYYQTKNGRGVDLILSRGKELLLIEIKSSNRIDEVEVGKLNQLTDDFTGNAKPYYLSQDKTEYVVGKVECLNWTTFLQKLLMF